MDSGTGSKVECARIRTGPSAHWPRGRFQAEHLNYGKLWGELLREVLRGGQDTHRHKQQLPPLEAALEAAAKV